MRIILIPILFISLNTKAQSPGTTGCEKYINVSVQVILYDYDSIMKKQPKMEPGCYINVISTHELKSEKPGFFIESFVMFYQNSDGDIIEIPNAGSGFGNSIIASLSRLKTNTTLYFDCIKARNKDGAMFYLKPFKYEYVKS
ncbi:MAG TPA: hypothetical protein VF476_09845 [Chitinophagaceae bacterium]